MGQTKNNNADDYGVNIAIGQGTKKIRVGKFMENSQTGSQGKILEIGGTKLRQ